ncbi:PiggyBac transposable element-derived protein 4 [Elysia marginata]|uniref:PiggyBac transposable element-derived protein 4 n=1 Tax=Elysia marginata TaxID=1093978 RepID=A0AAV4FAH0_9GAST|nr:PiggyBac transposable element-derived protein 4 [Elysia marginata]
MDVKMVFDHLEGLQLVRACFSRNRFCHLLTSMRFDDKSSRTQRRERDIFAPITDIWNEFQTNVQKHYAPCLDITIDEQLVPFRGRCRFLQYLPSKPDKYGLKIFWATDPETNYPIAGIPYLGKAERTRATNLGYRMVIDLVDRFAG